MKKYFYLLAAVLVTGLLFIQTAKATHVAGGEITYSYISPNTYLVTLKVYRDCSPGTATLGTTANVCYSSGTLGQSGNFTVTLLAGSGGQITLPPCVTSAQCYEEYEYEGTVTLPAPASDWQFSWNLCCRNLGITTIANNPGMVIYTNLDNVAAPVNSSPYFTYIPNIRFCQNNQFYYSPGAVDPDGDSLSYALVDAEDAFACPAVPTSVTYIAPWSATNPITTLNGTTLDPLTGTISFFPTMLEIGVICVQVTEWRNSVAIGTIKRDIQINIVPGCIIVTPTFNSQIMQFGIQANCGDNTFILSFSDPIQCGSVTATDVRVTDPFGFPNPVISAVPINCTNNLCDSILVTLFNPLIGTNGDTTWAFTKVGNDGNTFLGECGTQMPEFDSIAIYVTDNSVFNVVQQNVGCYFNSLTLNFNVDFWCQTIAGDLSDLTLTDATGTVIPITSITSNCVPGNPFSYQSQFTFNFASGATGVSPLYLTVNTGTDANTIANKCGTFFNTGDTLAILTILNNILINLGNDITVCTTDPVPVLNGGITGVTYQWYYNGNLLPDTTQSIIAANSGTYIVNVNYGATCAGSDTIDVSIVAGAQPNLGNDIDLCVGDPIPILSAGSFPGAIYQWYNGGVLIPGATDSTYTPLVAGVYSVIASIGTCTGSDTLTLTINAGLPVSLGSDLILCTDDPLPTLNANVTANSYQWYNGSTLITGAIGQTYQPTASGTYSVIATSSSNCTGADTIDVTINPTPVASLGPDTSVCITDGFVLNAQDPGPTYLWFNGGVLIPGANVQTYQPTVTGLYSVVVINSDNCNDTAFVNITVYPSAPAPNVQDVDYCAGTAIPPLDAGVTGVAYQWYDPNNNPIPGATNQTYQPTSFGTYTVVITVGTCTSSGQGTVTEIQNPTITVLPASFTLCSSGTYPVLDAGVQPAGATYQWNTGATTQTIQSSSPGGIYTVTVSVNQSGVSCTATAQTNVIVNQDPIVALGNDLTICEGDQPVSFDAGNTGASYQWFNGTTTQNLSTGTAGTYTVTVTSSGCTGTDDVTLFVNTAPALSITSDQEIHDTHIHVCKLDPFPSLTITTGSGISFIWTYPGGTTSTQTTIATTNGVYGSYSVVATDSIGCSRTAEIEIEEEPCEPIFHNVITANNDGDNDVWIIENFDTHPNHLVQIFNRWGQEVFKSSNYKNDWKGDDLPDGTYYYIVVTYDDSKEYNGTITKLSDKK